MKWTILKAFFNFAINYNILRELKFSAKELWKSNLKTFISLVISMKLKILVFTVGIYNPCLKKCSQTRFILYGTHCG